MQVSCRSVLPPLATAVNVHRSLQTYEAEPRRDYEGPSLALLYGVPSSHEAFMGWFRSRDATWLRRACTRVFLLQHGARPCSSLAGVAEELAAQRGARRQNGLQQALRLQVLPRAEEAAFAVRIECAHACCVAFGCISAQRMLDHRWVACCIAAALLVFCTVVLCLIVANCVDASTNAEAHSAAGGAG